MTSHWSGGWQRELLLCYTQRCSAPGITHSICSHLSVWDSSSYCGNSTLLHYIPDMFFSYANIVLQLIESSAQTCVCCNGDRLWLMSPWGFRSYPWLSFSTFPAEILSQTLWIYSVCVISNRCYPVAFTMRSVVPEYRRLVLSYSVNSVLASFVWHVGRFYSSILLLRLLAYAGKDFKCFV